MLPPNLNSPREVTLYYDSIYNELIDSGKALPFVYPWQGIGAFLVLGYLLLDHRHSKVLERLRYPVFAFLCIFQTWCVIRTRAKHPAAAFGVGLLSAWGVLWTASLLVVNDCQRDFKRLERSKSGSSANGKIKSSSNDELIWQECPTRIRERVDWIADVFCNFRGVGWNWQTSGIPPIPTALKNTIDNEQSNQTTISKTGIRRMNNRTALLRNSLIRLAIGYILLDIIKTIMHHDAYFWGYMDAPPPPYLPIFVQTSPVLIQCFRLATALFALYTALSQAFLLGPLFFAGLLGPENIGLRGEPWMNPPDMFGSYACVLDHGLAGFWGGWWHQTFRFAFETAADKILKILEIDKKSIKGRTISLFVAFFLSGCLHAAGSYTQIGDTRPLMGPMRFFLLQPLGITIQVVTVQQLSRAGVRDKLPKWLRRVGNFTFVHVWGYYTAPLLVDDFAKGGNFLFEPIAFSPLRALGLGAKDDTWFCWWNGLLWWRGGQHWWDTGVAI